MAVESEGWWEVVEEEEEEKRERNEAVLRESEDGAPGLKGERQRAGGLCWISRMRI